eukprot:TRINITY_DN13133_c0_g1_i1.p1 TRINITY_DN13133_c0_g1~~TRINITY_DN13133_c0_g1_i1.p1  ORF type:complete len:418 (+),score=52.25 TRINITY_DN13133_c0_g1_i1:154-1254(+)
MHALVALVLLTVAASTVTCTAATASQRANPQIRVAYSTVGPNSVGVESSAWSIDRHNNSAISQPGSMISVVGSRTGDSVKWLSTEGNVSLYQVSYFDSYGSPEYASTLYLFGGSELSSSSLDISNISHYNGGGIYYSGQIPTAAGVVDSSTAIVMTTVTDEYDYTGIWKVNLNTGSFAPLSLTQNYDRYDPAGTMRILTNLFSAGGSNKSGVVSYISGAYNSPTNTSLQTGVWNSITGTQVNNANFFSGPLLAVTGFHVTYPYNGVEVWVVGVCEEPGVCYAGLITVTHPSSLIKVGACELFEDFNNMSAYYNEDDQTFTFLSSPSAGNPPTLCSISLETTQTLYDGVELPALPHNATYLNIISTN